MNNAGANLPCGRLFFSKIDLFCPNIEHFNQKVELNIVKQVIEFDKENTPSQCSILKIDLALKSNLVCNYQA